MEGAMFWMLWIIIRGGGLEVRPAHRWCCSLLEIASCISPLSFEAGQMFVCTPRYITTRKTIVDAYELGE